MQIVILGSEGFVGQNLVMGLSVNHEILTADMIDKNSQKNYTKFDVTNFQSVDNVIKNTDMVIDLVAHSLVSSIEGPIKNAQVNIIGLLNILEACKKNSISKIIFTSASSLIGEPQMLKVTEEHIAIPKTAYGITKLTSEHYLRLYDELNGLNYVIFRFFNIYGPFQNNGLIPTLYSRMINKQPLTVFGKGDQLRDYVYIKDIIPFFEQVITTTIADNQIFNMGTGKGTKILEIIELLSQFLDIKPEIEFKSPRPGEIGNFMADTTLLSKTFGNHPQTTIEEGLQKTVNWLKNNQK